MQIQRYKVGQRVLYSGRTNQSAYVKDELGTILSYSEYSRSYQIKMDIQRPGYSIEHRAHVPEWSLIQVEKERGEEEPKWITPID